MAIFTQSPSQQNLTENNNDIHKTSQQQTTTTHQQPPSSLQHHQPTEIRIEPAALSNTSASATSVQIPSHNDSNGHFNPASSNDNNSLVYRQKSLNNNNNNNNDLINPKKLSSYISQSEAPQGSYRSSLPQIKQDLAISPTDYPQDDKFKLFTIFGNDTDNEKLSGLPHSTTGSLSSIITTSIASSEPDPGAAGSGGGGGGGGDDDPKKSVSSLVDDSNIDGEKIALNRPGLKPEKWQTILLQVSIPFFLAGIGTIGAGVVLGRVEEWRVFKAISELFILVPSLLGLKGNLDMCLASRLSTQVNLGNMTSRKEVVRMIVGNIALVQVQAIVASFLVAMFATAAGALMDGNFQFEHVMLLTAAAMFTATSSCFVLDFVLVAVILLSQKYRLNPDNLATPLAASIGDVVSISLLSFIASLLFDNITTHLYVTFIIVACYLVLLPMWVFIVLKNDYTRPVLKNGWVPVLTALCISGMGGLVLDAAVEVFKGFVLFQPIINGIGGNLVSVQASKISTMLHQSSIIGIIPPYTKIFEWPWKALFKGVPYAKTARILICMSVPGSLVFIFVADYVHWSTTTITVAFAMAYLTASLLQVMLLLYIAHVIVHTMWKWKIDPDNSSIPYLTALGDLIGSSLLACAFLFLIAVNQEYGVEK